jgi:hypothetical protein
VLVLPSTLTPFAKVRKKLRRSYNNHTTQILTSRQNHRSSTQSSASTQAPSPSVAAQAPTPPSTSPPAPWRPTRSAKRTC